MNYYIVTIYFEEMVAINVNTFNALRSPPKHGEQPPSSTNNRFGENPRLGDAFPLEASRI